GVAHGGRGPRRVDRLGGRNPHVGGSQRAQELLQGVLHGPYTRLSRRKPGSRWKGPVAVSKDAAVIQATSALGDLDPGFRRDKRRRVSACATAYLRWSSSTICGST